MKSKFHDHAPSTPLLAMGSRLVTAEIGDTDRRQPRNGTLDLDERHGAMTPRREDRITDRVAPLVELAVALEWLGAQVFLCKDGQHFPIRVLAFLRYYPARRGEHSSEACDEGAAVHSFT